MSFRGWERSVLLVTRRSTIGSSRDSHVSLKIKNCGFTGLHRTTREDRDKFHKVVLAVAINTTFELSWKKALDNHLETARLELTRFIVKESNDGEIRTEFFGR